MSETTDVHDKPFTYRLLNRRTVAGIRKKVLKQGKRNAAIRFILAKSDQEKIAAWKQDFIRVLHFFNVRSLAPPSTRKLSTPFRLSWRSIQT